MWCWHRIKEQETGLCPACRTPYGDNPHAFSAVDVEEVLKANKEKEAAAKRERQQRNQLSSTNSLHFNDTSTSQQHPDNAEAVLTRLSNSRTTGRMDLPQDRQQLLGMRVIRRNLVYAVGLPPNIANEELLRRPEYFGQYGKISKIVLNRGTPAQGRPATASAYVTFVHKVS
jgi:CCR4-NOT transcription complex subunit 4